MHFSKFCISSIVHVLYKTRNSETANGLSFNSRGKYCSVCTQPSSCLVTRCQTSSSHSICSLLSSETLVLWVTESWHYRSRSMNILGGMPMSWGNIWLSVGQASRRRSLIKRLISGDLGRGHELQPETHTLNMATTYNHKIFLTYYDFAYLASSMRPFLVNQAIQFNKYNLQQIMQNSLNTLLMMKTECRQ